MDLETRRSVVWLAGFSPAAAGVLYALILIGLSNNPSNGTGNAIFRFMFWLPFPFLSIALVALTKRLAKPLKDDEQKMVSALVVVSWVLGIAISFWMICSIHERMARIQVQPTDLGASRIPGAKPI